MFECVTCVAMHLNNICMYYIGPAMTVSETTACNNVIISKLTTHGSDQWLKVLIGNIHLCLPANGN